MNLSLGIAPFSTSSRILPQPCSSPEQASEEREWLLRRLIIRGPQTTTMQFAVPFIFPDVSIVEWCNMNSVKFETYILFCGCKPYRFIRFIKVDEETHEYYRDGWEKIIGKGVRP